MLRLRSSFFFGRGFEVEDRESGLTDETGEVVDAGARPVGATEDEEGLRTDVDCRENRTPMLFEGTAAMGKSIAVEDEGEAEVESATVVGGARRDKDRLPAGIGKGAEFLFRKNPTDIGTGAPDDAERVAGLHDRGPPTDIVSECLSDYVDGRFGVAEDESLRLAACALLLETGHDASGMGMQAVANPALELSGIVPAEEVARTRRYERATLQHITAKIAREKE